MCAVHKILQELRAQMENSEDKCLAAGESGELLFSSQKQGIAPLLDLYQQYPGAAPYICDRVFGKAAVFVAALCGAREIFSFVASRPAIDLAAQLGLVLHCGREVPIITNRTGSGQCPIENSVMEVTTPEQAIPAIRARLAALADGSYKI